jgi:GNAT superfamily N-acetyltransferase
MTQQIQAYLKRQLRKREEYLESGPFSVGITASNDDPYCNYAVPAEGAQPTEAEVAELIQFFEAKARHPRLEYIPEWAPDVEPALLAAGFSVESRTPLMTCRKIDLEIPREPAGVEVGIPTSERDLRHLMLIVNEAFGSPPPETSDVLKLERRIQKGIIVRQAFESGSKRILGGGSCTDIVGGLTEIVGIGVSTESRGKGVGGYLTGKLAEAAFNAGANICFLMAATSREARIYQRCGFKRIGEVLHISK